jgi:hypothetical protein
MIITSVKGNRVSWPVQTTKNAYANLGAPWDKEHLKTCTFIIKNTGATNAAQIKVLGSVDSVNFDAPIVAEKDLAAGATEVVKLSDFYTDVVIQVKSKVDGSHTTINASAAGIPM